MFCPGCGLEEFQSANQFCRACGTDLRLVRLALETPADNITASAVSARDEIGRAIAAKIREMRSAEDLSVVVEDVLPEIEKFLESPEERRLRGIRRGMMVASVGVGAAIAFFFAARLIGDEGVFIIAGAGVVTIFVGLCLILNAILFSTPKTALPADKSDKAQNQRELDAAATIAVAPQTTNELILPSPPADADANEIKTSVTEHTTHRLQQKQPVRR